MGSGTKTHRPTSRKFGNCNLDRCLSNSYVCTSRNPSCGPLPECWWPGRAIIIRDTFTPDSAKGSSGLSARKAYLAGPGPRLGAFLTGREPFRGRVLYSVNTGAFIGQETPPVSSGEFERVYGIFSLSYHPRPPREYTLPSRRHPFGRMFCRR